MERQISIRKMTLHDIDAVYEIEHLSFSLPWKKESFYNELTNNLFATYFVAIDGEKVIGYCGLWVVMEHAQITNIAVLPTYRGKGIGEHLLGNAMDAARNAGSDTLSLEVRVSNHQAQGLYRKLGFQPGGIRKQYYTDNLEDAIVMWVKL
ncbi:ribosomal-protein-alanine N-acetyltransferase [Bacillus lacus]|uniref:[Ribosomal protein bS18]-alanine N-acetyltransferase n=1 Tax=Metabacillus lacus TaxID=1983721 RepID=A0A7X2IZX8_9BACI|nr:ribosomal protein S18-alanine N-acetyltransferase [Metabacillus lacus]MRX72761.1 ribosomal-protein-alanine N-acetyltransferase [Metabacillus lacus]